MKQKDADKLPINCYITCSLHFKGGKKLRHHQLTVIWLKLLSTDMRTIFFQMSLEIPASVVTT